MRLHDEEALGLLADGIAMRTEGERARLQIVEALRRLIGAEGGMMLLGSKYLSPEVDARCDANVGVHSHKSTWLSEAMRIYAPQNPVLPHLAKRHEPVYIHSDVVGKPAWNESVYYQEYLGAVGTKTAAGMTLYGPDGAILGGVFFGHPDGNGFTKKGLAPLRALARYVGRGLHEILEWERWPVRWATELTALVNEMSDAVIVVHRSPSGRAELLAASPSAARLLSLRDRGESRNLELAELLGASLEALRSTGQRLVWSARGGARFELKAAALPSYGASTLIVRLVPCEPAPRIAELPVTRLARDAGLTPREASVLDALSRGRSHKEVASELGLAYFTVTTHVRNLFSKLGVNNRVDAINAVRRARLSGRAGA